MEQARAAGFENLSIDLMYGLPNQTLPQWQQTLCHVMDLEPDHVSCYGLKVEPGTPLWEYKDCVNISEATPRRTCTSTPATSWTSWGSISMRSPTLPAGFASRHNLKYWTGGEYLGFGPSAASDFAGKRFTIARRILPLLPAS